MKTTVPLKWGYMGFHVSFQECITSTTTVFIATITIVFIIAFLAMIIISTIITEFICRQILNCPNSKAATLNP